jgi:RNA polymerase sigma-70 factor, ECF subfamily
VPSNEIQQPSVFRDAYAELRPVALRVALGVLGGDEDAAEDVVQDVFMHLWRHPSAYDPARGSLRTYVAMLTRSRAVDRWRASVTYRNALRRAAGELRVLPEATESAMERVIRRDAERRAIEALDGLPGTQRDAVLLAAVGLTAAEIAGHAGLPLGTAKSRVRLGLDKARVLLDDAA